MIAFKRVSYGWCISASASASAVDFCFNFFLCIRFIFFQQLIKKHVENEVVFNGIRQHKS